MLEIEYQVLKPISRSTLMVSSFANWIDCLPLRTIYCILAKSVCNHYASSHLLFNLGRRLICALHFDEVLFFPIHVTLSLRS